MFILFQQVFKAVLRLITHQLIQRCNQKLFKLRSSEVKKYEYSFIIHEGVGFRTLETALSSLHATHQSAACLETQLEKEAERDLAEVNTVDYSRPFLLP